MYKIKYFNMSIQKISENIKPEEDINPIGIEKISVISDIENYIEYILDREADVKKELLGGNPDLNIDFNEKKEEEESTTKQIIQNYFNNIPSQNIGSEIMMVSLNIIDNLEEYLKSKNQSWSSIEGKKKLIEQYVDYWFSSNKDKRNIKAWKNYEQKKQMLDKLNEIIPNKLRQEFFSVRGDMDKRKEVLMKYKQNIQEAVKNSNMQFVANYLNLDFATFVGFFYRYFSEEADASKLNIDNKIILQAIDMLERGYVLTTALLTIWKRYKIKLYKKSFWQLAGKIDPKYTHKWYTAFYAKNQQNLLDKAKEILGKDTYIYLLNSHRLDYDTVEPYSEKIKEALKTCGYQILAKLLKRNKYEFRKSFIKHFPEWWKENML